MRVLGIETSCDETGVAIYDTEQGLLAHHIYSQISLHAPFGGVVPELASRDHVQKILPLIEALLKQANLTIHDIEGIAYTKGPGLAGALLVGTALAKTLAFALDIPAIGVHHLEAHLLAPYLDPDPPSFPFLALLVSGGHTELISVKDLGEYDIIGTTIDDAAGEAFDKTAKLLGLAYPGGAALAALAERGHPNRFYFPRPMINRPGLDFSFSGLKTFALQTVENHVLDEQTRADIAYAFQAAVVETLTIKCRRALLQTHLPRLVVAGGVGANLALRQALQKMALQENITVYFPRLEFCTDNGAMVAYAGAQHLLRGKRDNDLQIDVHARIPLKSIFDTIP